MFCLGFEHLYKEYIYIVIVIYLYVVYKQFTALVKITTDDDFFDSMEVCTPLRCYGKQYIAVYQRSSCACATDKLPVNGKETSAFETNIQLSRVGGVREGGVYQF